MISITIDGGAQAQRAPQGVIVPPLPPTIRNRHSVRMYSPAEVRKWQTTARVMAAEAMKGLTPLKGQLEVIVWIYLSPPQSMSQKKRALALDRQIRPITRPDLDNYSKSILDALSSIVFLDDAQIVALHLYKYYDEKPRVVIHVEEIPMSPVSAPKNQAGLFQ
jgi:Holliday junction resolvase RusA-like endonuclease